jgi:hypothetical protein
LDIEQQERIVSLYIMKLTLIFFFLMFLQTINTPIFILINQQLHYLCHENLFQGFILQQFYWVNSVKLSTAISVGIIVALYLFSPHLSSFDC